MAESVHNLRTLSDNELIKQHDSLARNTVVGTQHYLDELNRRDHIRQTEAMLILTKWIARMTVVITVATILSVAAAIATLVVMTSQ